MAQSGFLLDENMPHRAIRKLLRQYSIEIEVWVVGQPDGPELGCSDPELLEWVEAHSCLLVTRNRASMPNHLRNHLAAGMHIPGILIVTRRIAAWQVAEQLYLIWSASYPDEYQDQIVYLPIT